MRMTVAFLENGGQLDEPEYPGLRAKLDELEDQIGESEEVLADNDDFVVLPYEIVAAAICGRIGTVLDWLGPAPIDKQRLNAKDSDQTQGTLLKKAAFEGNSDLVSILLQFGADLDPEDAFGSTPIGSACLKPQLDHIVRLLLEWGAGNGDNSFLSDCALHCGKTKLSTLLGSDLGGRRCEIIDMEKRTDLNGMTGIAEKYLAGKDRYKVVMEITGETFLVSTHHLKRRDRTPLDCGYYITFERGNARNKNRIVRNVFHSRQECQAFQEVTPGVTETERGAVAAAAEARAEEAAASLLADLDLKDKTSNDCNEAKGKNKKNKNKKKGKR